MRARTKATTIRNKSVENTNRIDDIDDLVARNEVTLDDASPIQQQSNNGEDYIENQTTQEGMSTVNSSQKRGKGSKDIEIEILRGMTRIAEAIEASASEYVKTIQRYAIKEGEIWNHLVELGFMGNDLTSTYLFLIDNLEKLRALLGVPVEMRKVLLQTMMGN